MSKLAQLRALRETRFEEQMPRKTKQPSASAKGKKSRAKTKTASARVAPAAAVSEKPVKRPVGNQTLYTEALASEICSRLANGETLRQICRSEHMPAAPTVRLWVLDDRESFAERYARARDLCLESWADEIIEIGDDGTNDWMTRAGEDGKGTAYAINGEHVSRSKLRVDNRKWLLSKLKPERYGDKVQFAGDPNAPIKHEHDVAFIVVDPAAN